MDASQTAQEFAISEEPSPAGAPAGTVVLVVSGEADLHVAPELRSVIMNVVDRRVASLVIDLSGVSFIDSTTLGVLLAASRRMKAAGGDLRVVIARREIRSVFELTLLDRVFAIDSTRQEALAALGSSPAL
jgi:anti-sigma B factor antagonist